jgi:hypothetical protein
MSGTPLANGVRAKTGDQAWIVVPRRNRIRRPRLRISASRNVVSGCPKALRLKQGQH